MPDVGLNHLLRREARDLGVLNGYVKNRATEGGVMGSKHWSQADKQALAALYPETSNEVLGRVFGKSPRAIGLLARSLGVCKSARYMAEEVPRIKPGQKPWNKGRSFDPGGRSVETRFQARSHGTRGGALTQAGAA